MEKKVKKVARCPLDTLEYAEMIDGQAVRLARLRAGYCTQRELASKVGCARNTISRAERGRGGASILVRIAHALGIEPRHLMKPQDSGTVAAISDAEEALSAFRKLGPAQRAMAVSYIEGLKDSEEAAALGAELAGKLTATEEAEEAQAAARKSKQRDSSA